MLTPNEEFIELTADHQAVGGGAPGFSATPDYCIGSIAEGIEAGNHHISWTTSKLWLVDMVYPDRLSAVYRRSGRAVQRVGFHGMKE
jgi:hypothetical protein